MSVPRSITSPGRWPCRSRPLLERDAARGVIIGLDETVSGETARRMCCDADLNRVVTRGASTILDRGTTTRLASDAQYYALVARDGGRRRRHRRPLAPRPDGTLISATCRGPAFGTTSRQLD